MPRAMAPPHRVWPPRLAQRSAYICGSMMRTGLVASSLLPNCSTEPMATASDHHIDHPSACAMPALPPHQLHSSLDARSDDRGGEMSDQPSTVRIQGRCQTQAAPATKSLAATVTRPDGSIIFRAQIKCADDVDHQRARPETERVACPKLLLVGNQKSQVLARLLCTAGRPTADRTMERCLASFSHRTGFDQCTHA
ncbi:hypothetical protein LZ30DRAFT_185691 [Colletotrichum cereale]|nr:hypothetical protein LZ30DRAFT_185691 [Colletotrichum cereale]